MTATDTGLRTGWEADTPSDDTVVRQAVLAHVARVERAARAAGARWASDDDVVMADLGLPGLFGNQALVLQPDPHRFDAALDRLDAFYGEEQSFTVVCPFPTADLGARGLTLVGHPPLMYLPAVERTPVSPPGLRIDEVTDADGLAVFERVFVDAYPVPELGDPVAGTLFHPGTLGDGVTRYWVGWVDGRPACTAAVVVHAGVNLVEFVSTAAWCRGRGYGAALTWAASTADPGRPAVLLASDDGRPVYQRMGYVALGRWTLWTRP